MRLKIRIDRRLNMFLEIRHDGTSTLRGQPDTGNAANAGREASAILGVLQCRRRPPVMCLVDGMKLVFRDPADASFEPPNAAVWRWVGARYGLVRGTACVIGSPEALATLCVRTAEVPLRVAGSQQEGVGYHF